MSKAWLALENGRIYEGRSIGAPGESEGEVVFTTSMTGYVEVLTDPSFFGQIVVATHPHVGNHGIQTDDWESRRARVAGLVVGDAAGWDGDPRSRLTLSKFLSAQKVVGISDLPTRELTLALREKGALRGFLSTRRKSPREMLARARNVPPMAGRALAQKVGAARPYVFNAKGKRRVVVLDFGVKRSLLDTLAEAGGQVTVLPASATMTDILERRPQAIVLSNGPGDPAAMAPEIELARALLRAGVPLLGVCLGHQLLGLAAGASAYKLKFGHHGANHPVKDLASGKILITAQNHGFAIRADSLPRDFAATHVSLNDGTLEGFRHRRKKIVALQFHPEGGPGPREARALIGDFLGQV